MNTYDSFEELNVNLICKFRQKNQVNNLYQEKSYRISLFVEHMINMYLLELILCDEKKFFNLLSRFYYKHTYTLTENPMNYYDLYFEKLKDKSLNDVKDNLNNEFSIRTGCKINRYKVNLTGILLPICTDEPMLMYINKNIDKATLIIYLKEYIDRLDNILIQPAQKQSTIMHIATTLYGPINLYVFKSQKKFVEKYIDNVITPFINFIYELEKIKYIQNDDCISSIFDEKFIKINEYILGESMIKILFKNHFNHFNNTHNLLYEPLDQIKDHAIYNYLLTNYKDYSEIFNTIHRRYDTT